MQVVWHTGQGGCRRNCVKPLASKALGFSRTWTMTEADHIACISRLNSLGTTHPARPPGPVWRPVVIASVCERQNLHQEQKQGCC